MNLFNNVFLRPQHSWQTMCGCCLVVSFIFLVWHAGTGSCHPHCSEPVLLPWRWSRGGELTPGYRFLSERSVSLCPVSSCCCLSLERGKLFRTSSLDPFTSLELPRGKLTSSPEIWVQCRLFSREPAGTAYFSPSIYQGRVKGSERTQEGDQAKFLEQGDPSGCVMVVFQQQKAQEFCQTHDQDGKFRRPDKKETSHLNSVI